MTGKRQDGTFWGDKNIFCIDLGGGYTQIRNTHGKRYQDVQLRFVRLLCRNFTLRKSVLAWTINYTVTLVLGD